MGLAFVQIFCWDCISMNIRTACGRMWIIIRLNNSLQNPGRPNCVASDGEKKSRHNDNDGIPIPSQTSSTTDKKNRLLDRVLEFWPAISIENFVEEGMR